MACSSVGGHMGACSGGFGGCSPRPVGKAGESRRRVACAWAGAGIGGHERAGGACKSAAWLVEAWQDTQGLPETVLSTSRRRGV
jgi:hypothetical protein